MMLRLILMMTGQGISYEDFIGYELLEALELARDIPLAPVIQIYRF